MIRDILEAYEAAKQQSVVDERLSQALRDAIVPVQNAHPFHIADKILEAIRPYLASTSPSPVP